VVSRIRIQSDSVDLIARKVLMSAVLYYGLDNPLVSDAKYDDWCGQIIRDWDDVRDDRQWQLRSPQDVKTSGFDFRITRATLGGARDWMDQHGMLGDNVRVIVPRREWKWSRKRDVEYLFPEDFKLVRR
jgi:hypothetical protein